jgi:hypothetical protein
MHNTGNPLPRWFGYGHDVLRSSGSKISLFSLVVANLVPLLGVLFAGWDAFAIVLLFWAENLVIGFYNILKMIFVKIPAAPKRGRNEFGPIPPPPGIRYFFIPFFTIHYGGFTAAHLVFILAIFHRPIGSALTLGMLWPVLGLFVSHGISFVANFLIRGERERTDLGTLMFQPYLRIGIIHAAVIVGGFYGDKLGSTLPVLVVLIGLKTVLDVVLHLWEHRRIGELPKQMSAVRSRNRSRIA